MSPLKPSHLVGNPMAPQALLLARHDLRRDVLVLASEDEQQAQPAEPFGCPREIEVGRHLAGPQDQADRKSTRLNSSHSQISYAVFCLKKKTNRGQKLLTRVTASCCPA